LPSDSGWLRTQRFETGWYALELAILLGRGREVADELVEQFFDPVPFLLDGAEASVPKHFIAICARASASTSARCFESFRRLRRQFPGLTKEMDDFLMGAERFVKQDFAGAAKAWRPLLGGPMVLPLALPDEMAEVFDHVGAVELAEQVDQEVMKRAGELNGATLGHARAALRAAGRGDRGEARRLAGQVLAAWSRADGELPVLGKMRQLVAQP
jgi:hypothetical protein